MWKIIAPALLATNLFATACPTGCEEYQGNCACDQKPVVSQPDVSELPSDEKPRQEQQHAWETGEITADMPQSLVNADAKLDAEKAQADAEGKRLAGLPAKGE